MSMSDYPRTALPLSSNAGWRWGTMKKQSYRVDTLLRRIIVIIFIFVMAQLSFILWPVNSRYDRESRFRFLGSANRYFASYIQKFAWPLLAQLGVFCSCCALLSVERRRDWLRLGPGTRLERRPPVDWRNGRRRRGAVLVLAQKWERMYFLKPWSTGIPPTPKFFFELLRPCDILQFNASDTLYTENIELSVRYDTVENPFTVLRSRKECVTMFVSSQAGSLPFWEVMYNIFNILPSHLRMCAWITKHRWCDGGSRQVHVPERCMLGVENLRFFFLS